MCVTAAAPRFGLDRDQGQNGVHVLDPSCLDYIGGEKFIEFDPGSFLSVVVYARAQFHIPLFQ